MDTLLSIYEIVWDENIWLPGNVSWRDLENKDPNIRYPQTSQLWITFPICLVIFIIRYIFETFVFRPLGRSCGLEEKATRPVTPNSALERIYRRCRKPNAAQTKEAATAVAMPLREVETWFRRRRNTDKYSRLKKFSECGWRFTAYSSLIVGGLWTLWSKPFFWDTREMWIDYPSQSVDNDVYWYYSIELAFYFSLLISLLTDVKRKDLVEMFLHHVATIILMVFSWSCNYVRVGTLVLMLHDMADIYIESWKMLKYVGKWDKLCDTIVVTFTIVWFITRLTIFPFRIIRSSMFESLAVTKHKPFAGYYVLNGLLCLLQLLNVIWFIIVIKMIALRLFTGQLDKDERSDSEMEDESATEQPDSDLTTKEKRSKEWSNTEENGTELNRRQ